jgi:cell division protein FtsI (penicillin-binding protein 3)
MSINNSGHSRSALTKSRIRTMVFILIFIFTIFALRLIDVQSIRAARFAAKANNELTKVNTLLAPRGTIYDVNGVELARSVSAINIAADQTVVGNPEKVAELISPFLNQSVSELTSQLTGTKRYVVIAKEINPDIWRSIYSAISNYNKEVMKEKDGITKRIGGLIPTRSYIRDYPNGEMTASLIGIINDQGDGSVGIESSLNSYLAGQNGRYRYANGIGNIIPGSEQIEVAAKAGTNIKLTIDRDVQWVAQNAISEVVKKSSARSGTVIVMDPKTGAILAQASAPNFDPSNTKNLTIEQTRNPAAQEVFEPGSTGKVITVAAALEEGKVTPETIFTIPDKMKIYDATFHDHDSHPDLRLTTTGLLAVSSNTGAIKVGQMLGKDTLYDYLKRFGIGESTNSKLPGESAGLLRPVKEWSGTSLPTFSFGQGYSVTALQATSVFATIANNGIRVKPTILAGTYDEHGNYTRVNASESIKVMSPENASELRNMLESVVSNQGTAPQAAISGYRIAGKTGTAQRYNNACSCYSGYTASFIGMAPADQPKYVVSVIIQDPKGVYYGGLLAAPVFKTVMSFVLQSEKVAPTAPSQISYQLTEAALNSKNNSGAKPAKRA